MKKKNLLTLGALVLSLGLTVTSCAGAKGEDGTPGKDGTNGTNGVDGKDGKDGKTYLAIIDLGRVTGAKVTQSAYFVEPGEKVTFTFESKTSTAGEVLVDLEFNGEVVAQVLEADDKGVVTFEYTTSSADKGIQITGGTFGTSEDYGYSLVAEHLGELKEKDNLLLGSAGSVVTTEGDSEVTSDWKAANWIGTEYGTAQKTVEKALTDLDKDATITQKIEAVKKAAETANGTIDSDYSKKVSDTKTKAKEAIKTLGESVLSAYAEEYKSADNDTLVAAAQAKVEACTTLKEISAVVDSNKTSGEFDQLVRNKKLAFSEVKGAYDAISTSGETSFSSDKNLESLEELLTAWGVSVEKLPTSIYNDAIKAISSASEIKYTAASGSTAAYTEYKAVADSISGCVEDLKDAIADAISKSYTDVIDATSTLSADGKTVARSKISNAVASFRANDKDLSSSSSAGTYISLARYASTSAVVTSGSETLVGVCEQAIAEIEKENTAFAAERLNAAKVAAVKVVSAKLSALKKDATFAQIFGGYKNVTTGATAANATYYSLPKIGLGYKIESDGKQVIVTAGEDYTVANSFVGTGSSVASDVNTDKKYVVKMSETVGDNLKNADYLANAATLAINAGTATLINAVIDDSVTDTNATVAELKTFAAAVSEDLDDIYDATLTSYSTAQKSGSLVKATNNYATSDGAETGSDDDIVNTFDKNGKLVIESAKGTTNSGKYYAKKESVFVTYDAVSKKWEENIEEVKSLDAVSTVAKGARSNLALLGKLDSNFTNWLSTFNYWDTSLSSPAAVNKDAGFVATDGAWFTVTAATSSSASVVTKKADTVTKDTSLVWKGFEEQLELALNANLTETQLTSWVNGLDALYTSDVANWKGQALTTATRIYNGEVNKADLSLTDSIALQNGWSTWSALLGKKVVIEYTYDATAGSGKFVSVKEATASDKEVVGTSSNNGKIIVDLSGNSIASVNTWYKLVTTMIGAKGDLTSKTLTDLGLTAAA